MQKIILKRFFFNLMNDAVFVRNMENLKDYRDIKLIKTKPKRSYLVSKPNYHTTKKFSRQVCYKLCSHRN